ncbi:hypothetical protein BLNAU_18055 [Blattamonas nauphoetae]|uniref:SPRY domain-containing protein n=1 Tax=Blattamonas nauphoetae TaxID=2049346 RepID=A0ABQ9X621_9EUKA|nr:hypothetical protein BLNAU_18055 [Blattamonas nauphoetae]
MSVLVHKCKFNDCNVISADAAAGAVNAAVGFWGSRTRRSSTLRRSIEAMGEWWCRLGGRSFSADTVQMLNVSFSDGTTKKMNESVVLIGANVRTTVNAKSFAGTLKPMRDTPEADRMVLVGQEGINSTVFPLALFVTGSNEDSEDESKFKIIVVARSRNPRMFSDLQQKLSQSLEEDEKNETTCESVLKWLSDPSVPPRNKVNSFQWFHIHTLLANHTQSQPDNEPNNHLLSQLLQRMMIVLNECFDSQTPIPNKRLLHSALSQLAQSPSIDIRIRRMTDQCLISLETNDEETLILQERTTVESIESTQITLSNLQQQHDQLQQVHEQSQQENEQLRTELANKTEKLEETERSLTQAEQTIEKMKIENARIRPIVASDVIVAFSPDHIRVNRSTVTRINSTSHVGCFTKPISRGIHRLSIITFAEHAMIGVIDAAEYPKHLTSSVYGSPKAALMQNYSGYLYTACKQLVQNTKPLEGQEFSAEADLEKRTLHFFINGMQQLHHFIDIPVPLVFALDTHTQDVPIEITFWGEIQESHAKFQGTGHNLG